ncbi:MaoC family dehydratase N-terminal domain-containing protein [Methylobacterium sp. E-046]|uniref:FAS1-like dehydratase domain-containing protein n=1 Tax=Methylobacterium sp. E-046 TaxID=2836576 RepID=UPI001FBBC45F|nr:MaoC family dehydratase N-terminal domain-containing protein [Methylobacterium sp. E-046]MCJ2097319.1 MaoC family dehydratase N-terminal domain-containing protein [Methylobacterium sp. E-046]
MSAPDADLAHLRGWIGREETHLAEVTEDLVARFHATLDRPGSPPRRGEPAPRLIHHCLSPQTVPTATLAEDGHPQRGGFLPPVPLPRRMWAGSTVRFHRDIHVGDAVERRSSIADVSLKQGRTGPLCFVTVEHALSVDGERAISERQDIVYRGAEDGAPGKSAPTTAPGCHTSAVEPGAPLLFRYSALLFFAHRIHYDRRYAIKVERYPGLVVHGPLQAVLLMNFAADLHGAPPDRFSFRSGAPLFDDGPFTLNADESGDGLALWTAGPSGAPAMRAEAGWGEALRGAA